jgi:ParB family chromosome partitioning protein
MSNNKSSLGSGLDAIFSLTQSEFISNNDLSDTILTLPVGNIIPSAHQPRVIFAEQELIELSQSIKTHGIIQPIILRLVKDNQYEIIAGERRWRAAKMAGLTHVPAIIRNVDNHVAAAFSLIENIQRQDLNPLEQAQALHRLLIEFSMSHEQVAQAVGRSRTAVTNIMRLLNLTEEVKDYLLAGKLDMGHARALLSLADPQQIMVAQEVINKNFSVRQTEQLIKQLQNKSKIEKSSKTFIDQYDNLLDELEELLMKKTSLISGIKITPVKGKYQFSMQFNNLDELKQGIDDLLG